MSVKVVRRRFTVGEYYRMAAAGILREDDRVELIDGEVVRMSPIGPDHGAAVNRLTRLFSRKLGDRAIVAVQNPVHLDAHSEPQPDVALLHPRPDFYAARHPRPEDIFLVVEVADTTAESDREVKIRLYARAGIVEAWLVDLVAEKVEVYRKPGPGEYEESLVRAKGEPVSPAAFPDVELPVAEIIG